MRARVFLVGAIAAGLAPAARGQEAQGIETVTVIAVAPMPGTGIDANKIAGETQTLSMSDLARDRPQDAVPNAVATRLSSVSLGGEEGSPFQPDFIFRGFHASPVSGSAEGLAVYQDGVRLNESFGDTVNWDLIPEFAVDRFTVQSNNPVFGLNALGGAVTLTMKNGLNFEGTDVDLSGGSFGNLTGHAEYGARFGKLGIYFGIGGVEDDGFRYHSPTALRQAYGDLAWQNGRLALHLSASGALDDIGALGPTPVQLLAQDPRAVFTWPQSTENGMELVQLRGSWRASDTLSLSANTYVRHFIQHLVDGNTTDVATCTNDPAQLCLEGSDLYPRDALYDAQGKPVPTSALPPGATPGETDFTRTDTTSEGAALQGSLTLPIPGHDNTLVAGASLDRGATNYAAQGELGTLMSNLEIAGSGVIIDQSLSPTAQPPIEAPVNVDATNTATGVYALDVFDLTSQLSWTLSGRLNIAQIGLRDRLGGALTGDHAYTHFNPGTGLAYKLSGSLTAYAGYSESNRAPTAGELSCSNPVSPCLLGAFLVSDPALKQVVSRNIEAGLRGSFASAMLPGRFSWSAGAYRTDAQDDIQLLATSINGFGFFSNAGTTRHQGVDLHLGYLDRSLRIDASYSWLDAIFLNSENLSSNSPAANAQGLIHVAPGDRLP
ncbi:MAG TPA: TonB-dependent receptor, partial [Rhizomicrobium sp.]|nr:TonB-dependent receptor [Rhizomicrobium sp.]